MRYQPTQKLVRCLFAAEGYLELNLPERAIRELDRIDEAGELEPYCHYLRGQALRVLERYEEAISPLQEAARTIPAPFNQHAWEDLSDCFRREGLQELADVAEMFAEDPMGGADRNLCGDPEPTLTEFLSEVDQQWEAEDMEETWCEEGEIEPWDDEFAKYDFDGDFGTDTNPHRQPPRK